jgi:hypothetical protein
MSFDSLPSRQRDVAHRNLVTARNCRSKARANADGASAALRSSQYLKCTARFKNALTTRGVQQAGTSAGLDHHHI